MSRRNPTLAEAVRHPRFRLELAPVFVASLASIEVLGVEGWADQQLYALQLNGRKSVKVEDGNGNGTDTFHLDTKGGRSDYAANRRKWARWAMKLGMPARQAIGFVPEDGRADAVALVAEEIDTARSYLATERAGTISACRVELPETADAEDQAQMLARFAAAHPGDTPIIAFSGPVFLCCVRAGQREASELREAMTLVKGS